MDDRALQGIFNYRKLSERIATSGQPSEAELAAIAQAGYQVVVNLGLLDQDYSLADERGVVEFLGLEYVHIPVLWERPTRADLEAFFRTMEEHQGKSVWVHCAANMRVSVFVALYRALILGWPLERALPDVYALWVPNETWQRFIDTMAVEHG
jgi:uncharacterized protein (TIGR01244 family)